MHIVFQIDDETRRAVDKITVQRKQFLVEEVTSNFIKRWSVAESFTIFENHVYSH